MHTIHNRPARALLAIIAIFAASAAPAIADPPTDAVEGILSATQESIVDEAVPVEVSDGGSKIGDVTNLVTFEEDSSGQVGVEMSGGNVEVVLPVDHMSLSANSGDDGIVSWQDDSGVIFAPLVSAEGAVQVNTIIPDNSAPHAFTYELSLPDDFTVERVGESYMYLDSKGELIVGLAPAWAVDAGGDAVPTHFEVHGNIVKQVVEFDEDTAFPVVADPFLGKNLFKSIGYKHGKYYGHETDVVTLNLSTWGWAVYVGNTSVVGFASGQYVLNDLGWKEALGKGGRVKALLLSKSSMRQQYSCHALGAPFAGTWELETFRLNRTRSWTFGVGVHRCNWTTADRT